MFSIYFSSTHSGSESNVSLLERGRAWEAWKGLLEKIGGHFLHFWSHRNREIAPSCILWNPPDLDSQGKVVSLVSIPLDHSSKAAMFPSSSRSAQISSEEGEWSYTRCITISTPGLTFIGFIWVKSFSELANIHQKMILYSTCCYEFNCQNMPNAPKCS